MWRSGKRMIRSMICSFQKWKCILWIIDCINRSWLINMFLIHHSCLRFASLNVLFPIIVGSSHRHAQDLYRKHRNGLCQVFRQAKYTMPRKLDKKDVRSQKGASRPKLYFIHSIRFWVKIHYRLAAIRRIAINKTVTRGKIKYTDHRKPLSCSSLAIFSSSRSLGSLSKLSCQKWSLEAFESWYWARDSSM